MTTQHVESYLDATLPVTERVADLLARMTREEKVGQMMQLDARDDLEQLVLGGHVGSILHTSPEGVLRAHELTDQTRLRIPLLVGEDCIHGHSFWEGATIFPTQLGMAASWDPALIERAARVTAVEVAATGIHWTFSPVLCITRDLRWGRVDETFGEDPFLIGELASAATRATGSPMSGRSSRRPSTSPATPRRRAAATPARPTSPTGSCARGSFRRSSGSPARDAAPSCSATRPPTACRSRSTTGC